MLKLFMELMTGEMFHHGDAPWRVHIKKDSTHFITPEGSYRRSHPHVVVVPEKGTTKDYRSIYGSESTTNPRR